MHDTASHPLAMSSAKDRGAVYTRKEVVEAMLDLSGYTSDRSLARCAILEPCCGEGDFLIPIVLRLLESYFANGGTTRKAFADLKDSVRAVEISSASCRKVSASLVSVFAQNGISSEIASRLIETWLIHADFLLADLPGGFEFVVGNPPYLRQERIPDALLAEYRRRFRTLYDRADIYVPFIERSLTLLKPDGHLCFICADRWMKNRYGGPLRSLISTGFHLKHVLNMNEVSAFTADVIAYPAIFVIENTMRSAPARIAVAPKNLEELRATAESMRSAPTPAQDHFVEMHGVVSGDQPWLTSLDGTVALIRRLEEQYPTLEDTGCRVGIGVATGADKVFIGPFETLPVEAERKLPMVVTKDIYNGEVEWTGLGVINPFEPDGSIAQLDRYPLFKRYIERHAEVLCRRNVAKRSGTAWYRTIDRIYAELVPVPKLLIPDIKGSANVVYEEGRYYPHHNLYYVTSQSWDLRALQGVILSSLFQAFMRAYSLQMQGGFLRFQAQYLRRVRLPKWIDVSPDIRKRLSKAAQDRNFGACDEAVSALYSLSNQEIELLKTLSS